MRPIRLNATTKLKETTLCALLLVACTLPAMQSERLLSLVPVHYPVFVAFVGLVYLRTSSGSVNVMSFRFFIFFVFYYLYSLTFVSDKNSATIYFILWVVNIIVFNCGATISARGARFLTNSYCSFILISLTIGAVAYFALGSPHANPYLEWDKNNFSFAVYLAFILAIIHGNNKVALIISVLSVLIFSRTLLLMYMVVLTVVYVKRAPSTFGVVISFSAVALVWGGDILISSLGFLGERISGAVSLVDQLSQFVATGEATTSVELDDWRRYYLFIANIDIVKRVFPFGTGMGLENYLANFDPKFLTYTIRAARAHNFLISYSAEMGALVVLFFWQLWKVYMRTTTTLSAAAFVGLLVGLTTNEYITAPMPWLMLGLLMNHNIAPPRRIGNG